MTEHPITPPPELVQQWIAHPGPDYEQDIATQAARWGYDQAIKELETFLEKANENRN